MSNIQGTLITPRYKHESSESSILCYYATNNMLDCYLFYLKICKCKIKIPRYLQRMVAIKSIMNVRFSNFINENVIY